MKIGIVTFWESTDNYGQVLQAYALQKVLKKMGHEPFQIKYHLSASIERRKVKFLYLLFQIILIIPFFRLIRRKLESINNRRYQSIIEELNKQREFNKFRENNIVHGNDDYYSIDDIRNNPPIADCYITGSDQVWTMLLNNDNNSAYFLDFGDERIKRISYAASFARPYYPKELCNILEQKLSVFNAISVREDEGLTICYEVNRQDAVLVLDPTMLLSKYDYETLLLNVNLSLNDVIYVYAVNISDKNDIVWNKVIDYAKQNNKKLIVTTSSGNIAGREILSNAEYKYATIPEWLYCIKNSDMVLTTSFHGVVFCLIFNRKFIYFPISGINSIGNNRVKSLLKKLDLEKFIYSGDKLENIYRMDIDWDIVNTKINSLKQNSLDFLSLNL